MTIPRLRRILCVEDDPDIQAVVQLALEATGGFEIETCSTGMEALDRVRDLRPDLILLDVMMPEMDGPSTLGALREMPEVREIPVVFMTAKVQPHEIARYQEMGALDVVSKPFDPMTLSETVRTIWKRHHRNNGSGN